MLSEPIGFTEGDSEEWRWFVPHDLEGLIQLFGSAEAYVQVGGRAVRVLTLRVFPFPGNRT